MVCRAGAVGSTGQSHWEEELAAHFDRTHAEMLSNGEARQAWIISPPHTPLPFPECKIHDLPSLLFFVQPAAVSSAALRLHGGVGMPGHDWQPVEGEARAQPDAD